MANSNGRLLAFEGAQGFGAYTSGGRGGEVIKVTNLNDSGKGSLRWALEEQDGPRIVVFEVGGLIKLNDQIEVNGDVTIAGQTAPGGITIAGGRLRLMEDNVIIRGLEIRPGDDKFGDSDYDSRDGISVGRSDRPVKDIMIDGNSVSWSVDEGISLWGDVTNVTISNNIIGESLRDSKHPEGEHSMALLLGDGASEVSILGNLFAHNMFRNPTIKDGSHEVEFINNLIYNYGNSGFTAMGDSSAHAINNVFIKGNDSTDREPIRLVRNEGDAEYYISGNDGDIASSGAKNIKSKYVFKPATTDFLATNKVESYVLKNAGANPDDRSIIDGRIVNSVVKGTGEIIDSQKEVGGYKVEKGTAALKDSDKDGIPDVYEKVIGSNAKASDANKDADRDGVANIEEYINGLIDGFGKGGAPVNQGPQQAPKPKPVEAEAPKPVVIEAPKPKPTQEASKDKIVVEAEDLSLDQGFDIRSLGTASGDKVIQAGDSGVQKASMVFEGATGSYDLAIDYFDENDGVSELSVLVNNKQVATWSWDQNLGTNIANHNSLTTKMIEGLNLSAGDKISIEGTRDGKEPLRIDKLTFDSQGDANSGPVQGAPSTSGDVIRIEAEDFDLNGFREAKLKVADNGKVIMRDGSGEHRADHDFKGQSGVYDILVDYFDEADGESELTLAVNGKAVKSWEWDDHEDNNLATRDNATTFVIENVKINKGDKVSLIGDDDGKEPLRIDAVEFEQLDLTF